MNISLYHTSPLQKYDFSAPNRLLDINTSHFSEYRNLSSVKNQHKQSAILCSTQYSTYVILDTNYKTTGRYVNKRQISKTKLY